MEVERQSNKPDSGKIPNGWRMYALGDKVSFKGGSQPPLTSFRSTPKDGYIRLIQIRDYKTDKYETYIPINLAKKFCKKDDIMIGRYGPPIFQILRGIEGAYNVALIKAIPSFDFFADYAFHFFKQDSLFRFVEKLSQRSSGQTGIDLQELKRYPLPIPSYDEQMLIANALNQIAGLITSLEKLISKKINIKQCAMQQLLKPKSDWQMKTYGEVFEFLTTATYSRADLSSNNEVGYVHYGDIHTKWDFFLDIGKSNLPSVNNLQVKSYSFLKEGDIIMADASEDYSGVGKSVEVKNLNGRKVISGLHTFLLRDNNNILVNGYKGYLHASYFIKNQFDRLATGMKVYGVSKNNLKTVLIPIPPKSEQLRISSILSDMDAEVSSFEFQLKKYKLIKDGMMQNLLTGKIRLV